jgi:hypothetical protein
MGFNLGQFRAFTVYLAIAQWCAVKLRAGTVTTPPEIVPCGAGDAPIGFAEFAGNPGDIITVRLVHGMGTYQCAVAISAAIARGTVLYTGANGLLTDASAGSAVGVALEPASGAGQDIEVLVMAYLSTTAGAVSIADAANLITAVTVEAALEEIMQGIKTSHYKVDPTFLTLSDGTAIGKYAAAGAGWAALAAGELGIEFAPGADPTPVAAQFVLPRDFDPTKPLVVHLLATTIKTGEAAADSPSFTINAILQEPGAAIGTGANIGGDTATGLLAANVGKYEELTLTIPAASLVAPPCGLTLLIHPKNGQLPTDDAVMLVPWIEVTRAALTA